MSIRSAFEIWSPKSHGTSSGQSPSLSELQSQSATKVPEPWTTVINEGRALSKARTSFMKWTSGLLLEQVWASTANAYYPVIHIACLFMANDRISSVTPAHNKKTNWPILNIGSYLRIVNKPIFFSKEVLTSLIDLSIISNVDYLNQSEPKTVSGFWP